MDKPCTKYKELFAFGASDALNEHLTTCAECRHEQEKQIIASLLIKEAAPLIKQNQKNKKLAPIAASIAIILISGTFVLNFQTQEINSKIVSEDQSIITQMGLPTDDYGLLTVE